MTLPINQVVQGNCIEVMRSWPAECINFVMFSPPYWGLRNYGENVNTVWGGDPKCEHDFIEEKMTLVHENRNFSKGTQEEVHGEKGTTYIKKYDDKKAGFCSKCGYWQGQLGLEPDYRMYVEHLVEAGREIKRVLRKDGSWYLNLGDTYAGSGQGHKISEQRETYKKYSPDLNFPKERPTNRIEGISAKCKLLMPYRVALALIDDGWICRLDIVWAKQVMFEDGSTKGNAMPTSTKDRFNTTHEILFHFVKSRRYWLDLDVVRLPHSAATIKRVTQSNVMNQPGGPKQDALNPVTGVGGNYNRPAEMVKSIARQYVKHDLAVGRVGNFSYTDPLHEKEYHPLGKNLPSVWQINLTPFPDAHFAVYGEALCERPIKSSCPVQVCRKCGRPRERVVEKKGYIEHPQREGRKVKAVQFSKDENRYVPGGSLGLIAQQETVGWSDCGCDAGFEPGIVLDPMCGSGTTLVAAKKLGRRFIGIDLSPDYVEMSRKRLARVEWPLEAYSEK